MATSLMGLPTELLCQILEEVGGSHLRRGPGAARLCLSRKWYAAAHPVYLSGLGTTHVKIYGHNLDELNSKFGTSGLRHLMYKNTRSLRLRFLGHWWDSNVAATYDSEDEEGNSIDDSDARNERPFDFMQPEHHAAMESWRDEKLRPSLDALFEDLRNFSVLESLVVEASSDPSEADPDGPLWDYLYQGTVLRLLQNLPIMHDLSSLTLDVCGMSLGFRDEQPQAHLCQQLATLLPNIENVRLRLPSMCSSIFKLPATRPTNVRLKTLIIKLHLPCFGDNRRTGSRACTGQNSTLLYEHLIKDSSNLLRQLAVYRGQDLNSAPESHGMTGLRISFKESIGPCIATVDCLQMRYFYLPEEFFYYEDDGAPCWYELEPGRLLEGRTFIPG